MSGIEELRRRVVEAEKRFGLINEQRSKYSERLVGLIDAVETRLRDQQAEIARRTAELADQGQELESRRHEAAENQALRAMLHSLLQAIEAGSRDVLTETMQAMDAKVSALIAESVALVPARQATVVQEPETTVPDTPAPDLVELDDAAPVGLPDAAFAAAPEEAREVSAVLESGAHGAGELTEAQIIDLLADAGEPEVPEPTQEQGALETLQAEDEPAAERGADLETEVRDPVEPESQEVLPGDGVSAVTEDEMAVGVALDDPTSAADALLAEAAPEVSGIAAAPETSPAVADLIQEDAADPDYAAIGDASDERAETASLEDIMRRVSRLVEEEGALGPLAAGSVRIGAGAQENAPCGPEAEKHKPAPSKKAASNG